MTAVLEVRFIWGQIKHEEVVMRKWIVFFFWAACLISMSAGANVRGDIYEMPNTTKAPVIDGRLDAIWKIQDDNFQNSYTNGATAPDGLYDLMGWSRIMWDNSFIYGFMYTQDDIINDVHANTYEQDGWELYFDADNSKGTTAANGTDYDGVNDIQMRMNHNMGNDATLIGTGIPVAWASGEYWANAAWDRVAAGVEVAVRDTALGWTLEWKMPLESLYLGPTPGTLIGFELQQNDNDSDKRDHISKWWVKEGDPSWNNASTFGTAVFSARQVGEEYIIGKASASPTIDGELDDVWVNDAAIFSNNFYCNGATEPDDYSDLYGSTRLMRDAANIYGFLEIWDDIIIDEHANQYERDGVECYFDADNSKGMNTANGTDYDGANDIQLRMNHNIGTDVTKIDAGFAVAWMNGCYWADPTWDRAGAGVKIGVKDTDFGYNIEWQIPLESLYLEPVPGNLIGYETQINDNDTGKRDHISHWWIESGDPSWNNAATWGTAIFNSPWYPCPAGIICNEAHPANDRKAAVNRTARKQANPCSNAVIGTEIPLQNTFMLAQNYPNPFNPSTRIYYCLKSGGKVRLSVYDVTGREAAVIVNGYQRAGDHQVQFEIRNLTSGVYFYRLETDDGVLTRKMSLVR
jgi:hypothetical protein